MIQFWISLIVFLGTHVLVSRTGLRPFLVRCLGERRYIIFYSLLSLVQLAWVLIAAIRAPRLPLWPWMHELYWFPVVAMLPAFILIVAGLMSRSPLSLMAREDHFDASRPPLTVAVTRHPVLWGFFLWAASHMPPNGEFPLLFMFALFAAFALAGTKLVDRRRRRLLGPERWAALAANTASLPLSSPALWRGRFQVTRQDVIGFASGMLLYGLFFHLHGGFFGVVPIPPL